MKKLNQVDSNKLVIIVLIIFAILGLILLFGFMGKQAENQNIDQIKITRDTRLVERREAENAATNIKYLYEIYDETSYYKAQQKLKNCMSVDLYESYFVDTEYDSVKLAPVSATAIKVLSKKISDNYYKVKLILRLANTDTGYMSMLKVTVGVKSEKIVEVEGV